MPKKGNKGVVAVKLQLHSDLQYRLGISTASMFPYSLLPFVGPMMTAGWARYAGYDFLQVLPHRAVTGLEPFGTQGNLPALYLEDAWNPVRNLRQAFKGEDGDKGVPSNWRDWFGFPNPDKCDKVYDRLLIANHPRPISHSFEDAGFGRLVELCPELDRTPEEIDLLCGRGGYSLVLDTEHIERDFRDHDPRYGRPSRLLPDPDRLLETIHYLAKWVAVVHVKNIWRWHERDMIRAFLAADHGFFVDFIAEFTPEMASPRATQEYMQDFADKTRGFINECLGG